MNDRIRNHIVHGCLVIAGLGVGLTLAEGLLALHDRRPDPRSLTHAFLLNGTSYTLFATDDALEDTDNAVLIVGDSFTAGAACALDRNYPSAFTRAAQAAGTARHAVNLGLPGRGPLSYWGLVRDFLAERPNVAGIVITLYVNDLEANCLDCAQLPSLVDDDGPVRVGATLAGECDRCRSPGPQIPDESYLRRAHTFLTRQSRTYRLFRESAVKFALATGTLKIGWGRTAFPAEWSDHGSDGFMTLVGILHEIKSEADDALVPIMVVIYPDVSDLSESNPYVAIYREVSRALTEELAIPVLSGFDAFLDNPLARRSMTFSAVDHHPSCAAHELFGEWVFAQWRATQDETSRQPR